MSRLAGRAELLKLAALAETEIAELQFLDNIPAEALRHLRLALLERAAREEQRLVRRLAAIARWLPLWLLVLLARFWFGPLITARLAGELPVERAAQMTHRLSPAFVAKVAVWLDPRRARELIQRVSVERIVEVARELRARGDSITMGRFVEFLPDAAVHAVAATIEDEGELLEIVFHVESRLRLDHLVRVLGVERVRRAILIVRDDARRHLWPKLLALVTSVGYAMQRELGDLAASQGDAVLDAIVRVAQQEALWEDLLPVIGWLSPEVQQRVINLPALREPAVMRQVLAATDRDGLWSELIALLPWMDDAGREAVAAALVSLPDSVLPRIAEAALLREQWLPVLDVVRRLPAVWQRRCLQVLDGYRVDGDALTLGRIEEAVRRQGIVVAEV